MDFGPTKTARAGAGFCQQGLEQPFALGFFPRQFTGTADRFGFFARFFLGRFLEMLLELHFTEHAFALELLFQGPESLIDIVVANANLHVVSPPFWLKLQKLQETGLYQGGGGLSSRGS